MEKVIAEEEGEDQAKARQDRKQVEGIGPM